MDAAACSDMSVARSVSVELGTSMTVVFDDRMQEIQDVATRLGLDNTSIGASCFRNPSPVSVQLNTNLALDSVQRLAFRLSFPLSL